MDRIYTLAVRAEGIDNNCLGSRPVRRSIARICASADALHLEPSCAGSEEDAPHGSGGRGARYDKQCVVGHVVFTKFCSSSYAWGISSGSAGYPARLCGTEHGAGHDRGLSSK